MKKKIMLFLLALTTVVKSFSQNGQLPSVTFPSGSSICDGAQWHMVFSDQFNGTSLDLTKWHTFQTWDGLESDDWPDGRIYGDNVKQIAKDANVIVSNGTCKLQLKKESCTWRCNTCVMDPKQTDYSVGVLSSYYTSHFDNGRFEARLKMPTFLSAHSTFWLWHGGGGPQGAAGVDEIDIAEAYGDPFFPYIIGGNGNHGYIFQAPWRFWNNRVNTYSLHAFAPDATSTNNIPDPPSVYNPYNMSKQQLTRNYPNQSWWNVIIGNYLVQSDWHTYTCEWDTAVIKNYFDGNLVAVTWKYYQNQYWSRWWWPFHYRYEIGSGCNPNGTYQVTAGYPYNTVSHCAMRFTPGIDEEQSVGTDPVIGQMEVDYVQAWQKHSGAGTDLCDPANSVIFGPNIICPGSSATYTAIPSSPGGTWFTGGSALSITSSSNSSVTVYNSGSIPIGDVDYYPMDPSCDNTHGVFLIPKGVDLQTPATPSVICATTISGGSSAGILGYFSLTAQAPIGTNLTYYSNVQYNWDIDYGPNLSLHHQVSGQYVSTPSFICARGVGYPIKWKLTITNACGNTIKTGSSNCVFYHRNVQSGSQADVDSTSTNTDSTVFYFNAVIPDSASQAMYDSITFYRVAQTFIDDTTDTVALSSIIEKIRLEELAPYILFDTVAEKQFFNLGVSHTEAQDLTTIYPNPTSGKLSIKLNSKYGVTEPVSFTINDIDGKVLTTKQCSNALRTLIDLDISNLPAAVYYLSIVQGSQKEYQKIVKEKSK